jgi:hypothetical protein
MGLLDTPLSGAMTLAQKRHPDGLGSRLGWGFREEGDMDVFLHSGGTGGYSSFFGFKRPRTRAGDPGASSSPVPGTLGVSLLVNAADVDLFELGMRLLDVGRALPRSAQVVEPPEVRSAAAHDMLSDGDFSAGFGAWRSDAPSSRIENGALCVEVKDGSTRYVGWPGDTRSGLSLQAGRHYSLVFRAWAFGMIEMRVEAKVGHRLEPYTPSTVMRVPAGAEPRPFRVTFVAPLDDDDAGIAFILHPGANSSPTGTFCLDDVTLGPAEP